MAESILDEMAKEAILDSCTVAGQELCSVFGPWGRLAGGFTFRQLGKATIWLSTKLSVQEPKYLGQIYSSHIPPNPDPGAYAGCESN